MRISIPVLALIVLACLASVAAAQGLPTPFSENFDGGLPSTWTVTGPSTEGVGWNADATPAVVGDGSGGAGADGPTFGGSAGSLNFNDGTNYEDVTDGAVKGTADSPLLSSVGLTTVVVSWQNNFENEYYDPSSFADPTFDLMIVDILDSGGASLATFFLGDESFSPGTQFDIDAGPMGTFKKISIDITAILSAATVTDFRVRFTFASIDGLFNYYSGWFIDNFTVDCGIPDVTPPTAPVLLLPADTSTVPSPPAITLDWMDSTDTSPCGSSIPVYDVFLDTVNPPLTLVGSPAASTFAAGVLPGGTYFWQVVARDSGGNTTPSPVFSFTVEPPLSPLAPDTLFVNESQVGAQNGSPGFVDPVIDQRPAFSAIYRDANTSDIATSLLFQVSEDIAFLPASIVYDSGIVAIAPPLPKDSRVSDLSLNVDLNRNSVYYWHIRFTDAGGLTGPFSSPQAFRIGDDFDFGVRVGSSHHGRKCYVATAAFGGVTPQVSALMAFRSDILSLSAAGRGFDRFYSTAGAPASRLAMHAQPTLRPLLSALAPAASNPRALAGLCAFILITLAAASIRRL